MQQKSQSQIASDLASPIWEPNRWRSYSGKKTNKHKPFRRDGVRDKQEPSLGQMGPLPGTKCDPSLGQTGLSLFNFTVKSPFCPVCPWDGWFVPGTIVPQGPSEKCLCYMFIGFLLPRSLGVVSPHLPGEILRAVFVNFSRSFPRFHSALVNFNRFFPQFQSV